MVHMPVRDADEIACEGKVGCASDIKADIQLRDLHHRLFPCDAVTNYVVQAEWNLREPLYQE